MDLWIAVTLAAAAVQTLRFVLQKRLKGLGFSTGGATFSRFVFAAPLALGGLAGLLLFGGHELAAPPPAFWGFVLAGGIGQIIATFCTVALFSERSFAVGIAFTKSETVQAAGFSALVLAEPVSVPGLAAILVGMAGVLVLSRPPGGWGGGLLNRAVVLGLLRGRSLAYQPSAIVARRWRWPRAARCSARLWHWPPSPRSRRSPWRFGSAGGSRGRWRGLPPPGGPPRWSG